MDSNKVGKFILQLRKDNNLTQQDFANMFGVTYQAVSKWENGKNIPDILILKDICKKFNVDINEILDGEKQKKNKRKKFYITSIIIIFLVAIAALFFFFKNNNSDFHFKSLSSYCDDFNISGSIAYNTNKSYIYISKVEYCGGNDTIKYAKIECILYEGNGDIEKKIDSYNTTKNQTEITLEEFLKDLTFQIDNYSSACKEFKESNLFLQIYATDKNDKITSYKIPLTSKTVCDK